MNQINAFENLTKSFDKNTAWNEQVERVQIIINPMLSRIEEKFKKELEN